MTARSLLLALVLAATGSAGCAEPTAQQDPTPAVSAVQTPPDPSEAEGARVQISGRWATVWASSELASGDRRYSVSKAFDGDPTTAWVEGVGGYGATEGAGEVARRYPVETTGGGRPGESVHVRFDDPVSFDGVALQPGFLKNARLYERNGVPTVIAVEVDGQLLGTYELPYPMGLVFEGDGASGPDPRPDGCYHAATGHYAAERLIVFRRPVRGSAMTVRLERAGLGSAHEDTPISELRPIVSGASDPVSHVVDVVRRPSESMAGADVQDLRGVYVSAYEVADYTSNPPPTVAPGDEGPLRPRVEPRLRDRTPQETYMAAAWGHLVDVGLVVELSPDGARVTGGVSDSEGDGEWAEVRPQLRIGPDGRLRQAREVVAFGAAPGCPGDLSHLSPISGARYALPSRHQP